jgi:hypothetical protein
VTIEITVRIDGADVTDLTLKRLVAAVVDSLREEEPKQ